MGPDEASRAFALHQEAVRLFDLGDIQGAVAQARQATELHPEMALYWLTLGRYQLKAGDPEAALTASDRALELKEHEIAFVVRGTALFRLRRFEESASALERAVALNANHGTLTLLARAQLRFDPAAALENANKALALAPESDEAQLVRKSAVERLQNAGSAKPQ